MVNWRILDLALRGSQLLVAIILLGLTAYFMHQRNTFSSSNATPFTMLLFSIVISATSLTTALLCLYAHPARFSDMFLDFILFVGYFAVFALLTMHYSTLVCSGLSAWSDPFFWRDACAQWNAAQSMSFVGALLWGVSFVLDFGTVWRMRAQRRRPVEPPVVRNGVAEESAVPRRWWFGLRRARA